MQNPFFSIIIPTFNSQKTLQAAFDSLLTQDYQNFEIVVIDGLSSDSTSAIVAKTQEITNQITFISEKDSGIYDAMNKAIVLSRGEWLYFLGSDDSLYSSDVLGRVAKALELSHCDILYGNVFSPKLNGIYGGEFDGRSILFNNISHQAMFSRRKLYERVGYFDLRYPSFADWEFNIRCLESNVTFRYHDIVIANFAEGGVSSVKPDVAFLRNFLFKKNLSKLVNSREAELRNVVYYDKWWRLIRSMALSRMDNINDLSGGFVVPGAIKKMQSFQSKFPRSLLLNGLFSKSLMFLSYLNYMCMTQFTNEGH